MDLFPWRKKATETVTKEAGGTQINKANYKNFIVKAIGFVTAAGASRADFSEPEYNLAEIKAAADSDSYIKMSLIKYSQLMYKAGYQLKGENEKAVEYVKMRFRIMNFATTKPIDILYQELADDLVKYSNAFLVKSRVDKLMPGVNAKGVFSDKPIGGYFRVDPASVKIKRDKSGTVTGYEQGSGSETKKFQPTEIIHFYMDKDANNAFGTPRMVAALEDVKLLRRIEGNIISLIYRFAIPIYQWKIGLPESGFQASDKEIKEAQSEIENMPMDGVIVTNEKTEIKAIGAEGHALDASNYLAYFEKRVFTALGVSESQMGRGGSKQDADSMEAQTHDTVKYIQRVMSVFIENYILNELLLEGGYNPIMNEQDIVTYEFNEISLETKVKVENHEMLKYQSNLIPFDEARRAIGKKSEVDDELLYSRKIDQKNNIEQIQEKAKGSLEIAKLNSQNKADGVAGNGTQKSSAPNKAVSNNNRPSNQHGTTSAKIKESLDEGLEVSPAPSIELTEAMTIQEKENAKLKKHKKNYAPVYIKYENLRNDITKDDADLDILISLGKVAILNEIKMQIQIAAYDGLNKAVGDLNKMTKQTYLAPANNMQFDEFFNHADTKLTALLEDIKMQIGEDRNTIHVESVFAALEYRLRFLLEFILPKIYWYSYAKTGMHLGFDKAYIQFNGSKDKETHKAVINTNDFGIDDIPAFHPYCDCKVSFKAGDKD